MCSVLGSPHDIPPAACRTVHLFLPSLSHLHHTHHWQLSRPSHTETELLRLGTTLPSSPPILERPLIIVLVICTPLALTSNPMSSLAIAAATPPGIVVTEVLVAVSLPPRTASSLPSRIDDGSVSIRASRAIEMTRDTRDKGEVNASLFTLFTQRTTQQKLSLLPCACRYLVQQRPLATQRMYSKGKRHTRRRRQVGGLALRTHQAERRPLETTRYAVAAYRSARTTRGQREYRLFMNNL